MSLMSLNIRGFQLYFNTKIIFLVIFFTYKYELIFLVTHVSLLARSQLAKRRYKWDTFFRVILTEISISCINFMI